MGVRQHDFENPDLIDECPVERMLLHPAQIQQGGVDCWLFALAFACDLARGNDPSEIAHCQSGMRQHLIRCLENEDFEPFTRQDRQQKTPRRSQRVNCDIDLFCSCQKRKNCLNSFILPLTIKQV